MTSNYHNEHKKSENNTVNIGNASNPSLEHDTAGANQLLGKEAEKYLREAGNIEDLPDPDEVQEMDN